MYLIDKSKILKDASLSRASWQAWTGRLFRACLTIFPLQETILKNKDNLQDELVEEGKLAGLDRTIFPSMFDDISASRDDFAKIKTTFRTIWLRIVKIKTTFRTN